MVTPVVCLRMSMGEVEPLLVCDQTCLCMDDLRLIMRYCSVLKYLFGPTFVGVTYWYMRC